jgi:hypothetical protein
VLFQAGAFPFHFGLKRVPFLEVRPKIVEAKETPAMRTTVLAYVIAAVGLLMLLFGAWGFIVLNYADIDIALTDEAIVFGLIGGGFAMIGLAQALRLLLVIVKNTNQALTAC